MKTDIDRQVIIRVKEMRMKLDYSQRVLANVIGKTPGFIGQVESENCQTKYTVDQIYYIAKYFGCQVSDLFPPINPIEP